MSITETPSLVAIIDAIENWEGAMHVHCVQQSGPGFWEKMIPGITYLNITDNCYYEQNA